MEGTSDPELSPFPTPPFSPKAKSKYKISLVLHRSALVIAHRYTNTGQVKNQGKNEKNPHFQY
jgi:hypothetical protein